MLKVFNIVTYGGLNIFLLTFSKQVHTRSNHCLCNCSLPPAVLDGFFDALQAVVWHVYATSEIGVNTFRVKIIEHLMSKASSSHLTYRL